MNRYYILYKFIVNLDVRQILCRIFMCLEQSDKVNDKLLPSIKFVFTIRSVRIILFSSDVDKNRGYNYFKISQLELESECLELIKYQNNFRRRVLHEIRKVYILKYNRLTPKKPLIM